MRRVYGPYRVKHPMVRKGFKQWVEAGFPEQANGLPAREYFHRGTDGWVRTSWDEAQRLVAQALLHIMGKYQGEAGARGGRAAGVPSESVEGVGGGGAAVGA